MTTDLCTSLTGKNVWQELKNVQQSAEGLPDILSGRLEITFVIIAFKRIPLDMFTKYIH